MTGPTYFTDAFGQPLAVGDTITFQHKTSHTPYNRGAARYVKAVITGFTAKMLVVRWIEVQQLAGYEAIEFKEAGTTGHWNPGLCVLLQHTEPEACV